MDGHVGTNCDANLGFTDEKLAPYIDNIGYDSNKNKMFGTSATNNHDDWKEGKNVIIFTVVLDSNGDASLDERDLKMAKITDLGDDSRFYAVHKSLTTDGSFVDWIHCIYAERSNEHLFYMKMTPEDASYSDFTAHRLNDENFTTYSAWFTDSIGGTVGSSNSYSGYQAYIAGASEDY